MFAESTENYSSDFAKVNIVSAYTPGTFPLTTDNISNLPDGIKLAPGSTFYNTTSGAMYMLGDSAKI